MATIIDFAPKVSEAPPGPSPRAYYVEVTAYPDNYLEFKANGIRTDARSLYQIAAELEKIASIIRSDVITDAV